MSWLLEGRALNSLLISRLRYLGDVVMATPLLEVLKKGDPQLRLGFLAEKTHGLILEGHPHLDHLHLLDTTRRGADAKARAGDSTSFGALPPKGMIPNLINSHYDLAVDLFFNPRSAWLLRMAGIRHRIGGTRGSRRWLYSHTVVPSENQSRFHGLFQIATGGMGEHLARLSPLVHKESNLPFLDWFAEQYKARFIAPHLPRKFWSRQIDDNLGELINESNRPPIILAPGATWSTKEWPLEYWERLVQGLVDSTSHPLFVLQPPGGAKTWSALGKMIPAARGKVLPVLDLPKVLGMVSSSALLVSVDGGIMHTGVGLGVPTIGLFGPTDPTLWFPYENAGPFRVMTSKAHCSPCDLHECNQFICLPEVHPAQVLDQCLNLLGNGGD